MDQAVGLRFSRLIVLEQLKGSRWRCLGDLDTARNEQRHDPYK
jgi:hypothetical protein